MQAYITLLLIHGRNTWHSETMFLDKVVYVSTRFNEKAVLDVKTHFKQMETFQYTHFTFVKESSKQTPLKQRLWKYHSN